VGTTNRLLATFGDKCDFLCVYLMEAHAQDEWPLYSYSSEGKNGQQQQPQPQLQHKSLFDRKNAAMKFKQEMSNEVNLVVDSWENDFDSKFAAWPERAYVLDKDGRVGMISRVQEDGSIDWERELEGYLTETFGN